MLYNIQTNIDYGISYNSIIITTTAARVMFIEFLLDNIDAVHMCVDYYRKFQWWCWSTVSIALPVGVGAQCPVLFLHGPHWLCVDPVRRPHTLSLSPRTIHTYIHGWYILTLNKLSTCRVRYILIHKSAHVCPVNICCLDNVICGENVHSESR